MQQVQEKQQQKSQTNHNGLINEKDAAYRPSPMPFVLSTTAKVCYGLSAASIVLSVGVWNRISIALPFASKKAKAKISSKPSEKQYHESQRLGAFVGLWAPTFAVAGKVLDDASERVAQYDFAQWEKKQAEKVHSAAFRARFFTR